MPESSLPSDPGVVYKSLNEFPRYLIGSDGSVWSCCTLKRAGPGGGFRGSSGNSWRRLKTPPVNKGYLQVNLRAAGKSHRLLVHSLVAKAFIGPRPSGMEVCHWDGNPANNALSNIRYGTYDENRADMRRHGRSCAHRVLKGEQHPFAKFSDAHVIKIRDEYKSGQKTIRVIADEFNVSWDCIHRIVRGKAWRHLPL